MTITGYWTNMVRCENCWLSLQGIQPCECKGKGHRWVDNQVFRLGCQYRWRKWRKGEVFAQESSESLLGNLKTEIPPCWLNTVVKQRDIHVGIFSHSLMTKYLVICKNLLRNICFVPCIASPKCESGRSKVWKYESAQATSFSLTNE